MATFVPRAIFPTLDSLPRSYFLGHHRAGLNKMKSMLSCIDLVIECRDYRVPLTSQNPLFEAELAGRKRLILYTKQDLGTHYIHGNKEVEDKMQKAESPTAVLFSDHQNSSSTRRVLKFVKEHTIDRDMLYGSRMMVVGMPNVGKSSLLNALRRVSMNKGKAARTGDQPGVTRKIGTTVKIIEGSEDFGGVYLVDTPGVFIPYIPDPESMLKLALCGSVKDTIIAPSLLADYLLFHLNKQNPEIYAQYSVPTNDVSHMLEGIAKKTGRLQKGGIPDMDASALWIIQRWRDGKLGKFVLDDLSEEFIAEARRHKRGLGISLSQAKKDDKIARKQRNASPQADAG